MREWASVLGIFVIIYGSSTKAQSIPGSNGDILYNNNGVMGAIPTANNGVLVTNGAGLPSVSSTLPEFARPSQPDNRRFRVLYWRCSQY